MIEIRITKELGNYEPKFVGPFTLRQLICVVVGVPVCFLIYSKLSPILTSDIAGFFCVFPAALAVLIGWIKPYGMKMEKFIQSMFINMVIAPANRKYRTENIHEQLIQKIEKLEAMSSGESMKEKSIQMAADMTKSAMKAVKKGTNQEVHVYE